MGKSLKVVKKVPEQRIFKEVSGVISELLVQLKERFSELFRAEDFGLWNEFSQACIQQGDPEGEYKMVFLEGLVSDKSLPISLRARILAALLANAVTPDYDRPEGLWINIGVSNNNRRRWNPTSLNNAEPELKNLALAFAITLASLSEHSETCVHSDCRDLINALGSSGIYGEEQKLKLALAYPMMKMDWYHRSREVMLCDVRPQDGDESNLRGRLFRYTEWMHPEWHTRIVARLPDELRLQLLFSQSPVILLNPWLISAELRHVFDILDAQGTTDQWRQWFWNRFHRVFWGVFKAMQREKLAIRLAEIRMEMVRRFALYDTESCVTDPEKIAEVIEFRAFMRMNDQSDAAADTMQFIESLGGEFGDFDWFQEWLRVRRLAYDRLMEVNRERAEQQKVAAAAAKAEQERKTRELKSQREADLERIAAILRQQKPKPRKVKTRSGAE